MDNEKRVRVRFIGADGSAQFTGTLPESLVHSLQIGALVSKNQRIFKYYSSTIVTDGRVYTFMEVGAPIPIAQLLKRT